MKPDRIDDAERREIARDIVKRIENELEYPGSDQGDRHPRDPGRRIRPVTQGAKRSSRQATEPCRELFSVSERRSRVGGRRDGRELGPLPVVAGREMWWKHVCNRAGTRGRPLRRPLGNPSHPLS